MAISGTHLSILGWGFYKVLLKCRFPIKASGILAAAGMVFYGGLNGKSGSGCPGSDHVWSFCRGPAGKTYI